MTAETMIRAWAEYQTLDAGADSYSPQGLSRDATISRADVLLSQAEYVESTEYFGVARLTLLMVYVRGRGWTGPEPRVHRLFREALEERLIEEPWEEPEDRETLGSWDLAGQVVSEVERSGRREDSRLMAGFERAR